MELSTPLWAIKSRQMYKYILFDDLRAFPPLFIPVDTPDVEPWDQVEADVG